MYVVSFGNIFGVFIKYVEKVKIWKDLKSLKVYVESSGFQFYQFA